jgi:hypothetical protein
MGAPWMLVLAAGAVRVMSGVAWSWLAAARQCALRRDLAVLLRAAGPGATVVDRRADGAFLAIWTQGPGKGGQQEGTGR